MRRLLFFLLAFLATTTALAAGQRQYCGEIYGTWNTNDGSSYTLALNTDGSVAGHGSYHCPDGAGYYNFSQLNSGQALGNGQFSLGFYAVCKTEYQVNETLTIPLGSVGCDSGTASGTVHYSVFNNAACYIPPSVSVAKGTPNWGTPNNPCTSPGCGIAHYAVTLNPPTGLNTYNWAGRAVTYTPKNIVSGCTPAILLNQPNGQTDFVSSQSVELANPSDDYVGFPSVNNVNVIRVTVGNGYNCNTSFSESLAIDCPNGIDGTITNVSVVQQVNLGPGPVNTITISAAGVATNPTDEPFGYSRARLVLTTPFGAICGLTGHGCSFL